MLVRRASGACRITGYCRSREMNSVTSAEAKNVRTASEISRASTPIWRAMARFTLISNPGVLTS